MRIFITGGAGFIGSHLVDYLMGDPNEVTVYDNLSSGKREFVEHHLNKSNFNLIVADLLDQPMLERSVKGHDLVIHLAANPEARVGIEKTDLDLYQETIATYNVLESMRLNNVQKIIFASSGTIYGETPVIPLPEDYGPILPISLYGAGKLASEGLITAFCGTFGFKSWILRFANIVGGRATHGVIYDLIKKLRKNPHELEVLGDGTQEKPYLFIEDCIEGMMFVFNNAKQSINLYTLGVSSSTTVKFVAENIIREMGLNGVKLCYTGGDRGWPGDVPQVRFDVTKINRLGWKAKLSSDEAVLKTIRILIKEQV